MADSLPQRTASPNRVRFEDAPTSISSPYEEGQSSASETEYQHALEVVFNPENSRRRKSSLVSADTPALEYQRKRTTECYVHAILEDQRRRGEGSSALENLAEQLRARRESGIDGNGFEDVDCTVDKGSSSKQLPTDGAQEDKVKLVEESLRDSYKETRLEVPAGLDQKVEVLGEGEHAKHSRLLTKKQLSDMAWGVRELGKRLGSIKLKLKVRTVFLLTKAHDESLIENTREVARWLLSPERQVKYTVYVEDSLRDNKIFDAKGIVDKLGSTAKETEGKKAEGKREKRLRYWNNDMCKNKPHTFDFVITLGGDGTVLYASWLFQRIVPPVLSFALGSLGFLTKFDYEEYQDILTKAFRDGVTISLRLRFECTVMRSQKRGQVHDGEGGGKRRKNDESPRDLVEELVGEERDNERTHRPDGTYEILNDLVVDRGPNPTMSSTEIFGDEEHFTSVQADGVCVATPTGSTAYNLAAGGSLCHPENPVMLITAICAHTLSFRPIILPDTIVLRIGVPYDARTSSWASFDGRERVELCPGDYVTVSASRYPFANVMPQGRRSQDWVNSLSAKLGWNTRQKQKSFHEWE